jgi:gamma-glutamylaminecyclotransferase|tara:strand:+ start:1004 stop:1396 length:393 start_codon:yes stop_codon:yes gene_type:complete
MSTTTDLVFVYGTLREGYGNHIYLHTSKKIGEAKTAEKYSMYEAGIPFVYKNKASVAITGEVYEVSNDSLYLMDMLEGHPYQYRREIIEVVLNESNEVKKAWLYFYPEPVGNIIESGDYEEAYKRNYSKV